MEVTMNAERKQILEMLAAGKISAEDAERLMDKLGAGATGDAPTQLPATSERPSKLKYLRLLVDSAEGDKVDIRVPLALIRTGIKLTAVLPDNVTKKLSDEGVDLSKLSELDGDELFEALRELQLDVDSSGGDAVRIFCE
jgi:polyhydroxyalkanoate synthesis regulator phasin